MRVLAPQQIKLMIKIQEDAMREIEMDQNKLLRLIPTTTIIFIDHRFGSQRQFFHNFAHVFLLNEFCSQVSGILDGLGSFWQEKALL